MPSSVAPSTAAACDRGKWPRDGAARDREESELFPQDGPAIDERRPQPDRPRHVICPRCDPGSMHAVIRPSARPVPITDADQRSPTTDHGADHGIVIRRPRPAGLFHPFMTHCHSPFRHPTAFLFISSSASSISSSPPAAPLFSSSAVPLFSSSACSFHFRHPPPLPFVIRRLDRRIQREGERASGTGTVPSGGWIRRVCRRMTREGRRHPPSVRPA